MNNCLILGSGRSGTSMIAGILHDAGYFMGHRCYAPRDANPRGFFEDAEINHINERILGVPSRPRLPGMIRRLKKTTVQQPGYGQWWLASIPPARDIQCNTKKVVKRIKRVLAHEPFAYKDPRFCYTLPVWKPFLKKGTVFICMFREPEITVESILNECRSVNYLKNLVTDREKAYQVWINMYSHVLAKHGEMFDDFVFLHYDQVYRGSVLEMLSERLDAPLTGLFVDKDLKRTRPAPSAAADVPPEARRIYAQLCDLAKFSDTRE